MIDVNLSLTNDQFQSVRQLIYQLAGISLAESKQTMVQGRLAKRLRALKLDCFGEYIRLLETQPNGPEIIEFINALTTNKTDFFREDHHFKFLVEKLLPAIKGKLERPGGRLRIWSAACSTGEEAYSIAMTLSEQLPETTDMRILASDVDTEVLRRATEGLYAQDRVGEIPKYLLHRYFEKETIQQRRDIEIHWRARPQIRNLVQFRRINFKDDQWPIQAKFDVIFCRNAMIYFDAATKARLVQRLADYLVPGGHLIIGHSESLSGLSDRFNAVGNTIYQLKNSSDAYSFSSPRNVEEEIEIEVNELSNSVQEVIASSPRISKAPVLRLPPAMPAQPYRLARSKEPVHPIIVGEIHATYEPIWISTLLGSCVAACLYDERARVGGMNHFMLPAGNADATSAASYGIHAMEMLINSLMKLGADRRRLHAKLFGGGAVIKTSDSRWNVGINNIDFAKKFLEAEGIPLVASHTGGSQAMHIRFHTHTQKALVRVLDEFTASRVVEAEKQQPRQITTAANAVTLF